MAKELSICSVQTLEAVEAGIRTAAQAGKLTKEQTDEILRYFQDDLVSRIDPEKLTSKALNNRHESIGIVWEELVNNARKMAAKEEQFMPSSQIRTKAKPGTREYEREVQFAGVFNQFTMANSQARIAGMVRSSVKGKVDPTKPMPKYGIQEVIARLTASDSFLRQNGISLGITKGSNIPGVTHYSRLTLGDGLRMIMKTGRHEELKKILFRNNKPTQNIFFQNFSEAMRRVVEFDDVGRSLDNADELAKLQDEIREGLTKFYGRPLDEAANKAINSNEKWLKSAAGKEAVEAAVELLTDPKVVTELLTENKRMQLVAGAMSLADGISMTEGAMKLITSSPWTSERMLNLGRVMFEDGLQGMYGNDALVKLTPGQLNLEFAKQQLAKVMSNFSDETIAEAMQVTRTTSAMAKSRKAGNKQARNNHKKQELDEQAEMFDAHAAKMVENPNVAVDGYDPEVAYLGLRTYTELHLGPVMGGMAKLANKVSDIFNMSGKGKTIFLGSEHRVLENATMITAKARTIADRLGQDTERINRVYNQIKQGFVDFGDSQSGLDKILDTLPAADQDAAKDMFQLIDTVFGNGDVNRLAQLGVFNDEMSGALKGLGLDEQAAFFENMGDNNTLNMKQFWTQMDLGEGQNALDVIAKVSSATQIAMFKPTLAASLTRNFAHYTEGLSRTDALKLGYKPILDEKGTLGEFLPTMKDGKSYLFPPEIVSNINRMNEYLDYNRSFNSIQTLINNVDQITSVMKSSLTIWRPGHHMVSLIGNTFFNALANVRPTDYAMAMKMLARNGEINILRSIDELDEFRNQQIPPGFKFKGDDVNSWPVTLLDKNGKAYTQMVDMESLQKMVDSVAGVRIAPRRTKDVVDEYSGEAFSVTRKISKLPGFKSVGAVDNKLARAAAARDNLARYALFLKEINKGTYRSLEEAALAAGQKVHEFHPTVGTLTAFERKYARRVFYFYTWQKQALFKIMELAMNQPALITVPSKFQYAMATAQGLNPESFGDPYDSSALFPAYNSYSTYGPQWIPGETESEFLDALTGAQPGFGPVGLKPALPQLDVIDSYLGQVEFRPEDGLWGNLAGAFFTGTTGIFAQNMAPALRIPVELAARQRIGGIGGDIDVMDPQKLGEYAIDQTGVGSLTRAFDWTPWGGRSDTRLDPYSEANRQRQWFNWLSGMKLTYYQNPAALNVARQEELDYWRKVNEIGKYAPKPTIRDIGE